MDRLECGELPATSTMVTSRIKISEYAGVYRQAKLSAGAKASAADTAVLVTIMNVRAPPSIFDGGGRERYSWKRRGCVRGRREIGRAALRCHWAWPSR